MRLKIPACSSGTESESVLKYLYTAIFMMPGLWECAARNNPQASRSGTFDPDIILIGMEKLVYGKY